MFYILEIGNINVAGINIDDEIGLIDFHLIRWKRIFDAKKNR